MSEGKNRLPSSLADAKRGSPVELFLKLLGSAKSNMADQQNLYDGNSNPFGPASSSPRAPAAPQIPPPRNDDALGLATTPPHQPLPAPSVPPPLPPAQQQLQTAGVSASYGRSVRDGTTPNRLMHVNAADVERERQEAPASTYGRSIRGAPTAPAALEGGGNSKSGATHKTPLS